MIVYVCVCGGVIVYVGVGCDSVCVGGWGVGCDSICVGWGVIVYVWDGV